MNTTTEAINVRLSEFHKTSGCDWSNPTSRCRQTPNVAVTARESGQGLMTFCAEHAAAMDCPMLYFPA